MARPRKKKGRTEKGLGSLTKVGRYFHFRIKIGGVPYHHPTRTETLEEAKIERDRFLKTLRAETGTTDKPIHETVTVAEVIDDYVAWMKEDAADEHAKTNAILGEKRLLKRIVPAFGTRLAIKISFVDLLNYRKERKASDTTRKKPPADSTINYELTLMRAAFNHARKKTLKVLSTPHFPIVAVDNIRQGFIEIEQYKKILACMPDSLKLFFMLAFCYGCRAGELTNLRWKQVNFRSGHIELLKTKFGERNAPFYDQVKQALLAQLEVRKAQCPNCEYVLFWHQADIDGTVRKVPGDQLNDFRKSWHKAVNSAGQPRLLRHDLRRTACRNMVQYAGLTEREAMEISGHVTPATFQRYNIGSLKGIKQSGAKMNAWLNEATATMNVIEDRATPVAAALEAVLPAATSMKQRVRELFLQGLSNAAISTRLGIQPNTVQYHISDSVKAATLARNREHKREARLSAD